MSIGKYDTPPPQAPADTGMLLLWATDLIAWLRNEESDPADTLEDDFIFGGEGVANRMYGFEGVEVDPAATTVIELLSAPAAGKKKIITDLILGTQAAPGSKMEVRLYKKKASTEYEIGSIQFSKDAPYVASEAGRMLVLDATDESLEVEIVTQPGSMDFSWNGNYLDVD